MNKTLMLVIMLCCIAADVVGQDTYKPMLTDGRSWVTVTTTDFKDFYTFWVDYETEIKVFGDTVIDGHSCKIIDKIRKDTGEHYSGVLLEEDRVIYQYDESKKKFLPLMDFNKHVGEGLYDGWYDSHDKSERVVLSEDTVEVNGIAYRRLAIGTERFGPHVYWVEGIGASKSSWITPAITTMGIYTYMKECYENGECIFTKDDFYKEASGVDTIPSEAGVNDDTIYDLQGRKRSEIPEGEIFIQNGKKYVVPAR